MNWLWIALLIGLILLAGKGIVNAVQDYKTNLETTMGISNTTLDKVKNVGESEATIPIWLIIVVLLLIFIIFKK